MYEDITVHVIEDHKQKSHMKMPVELSWVEFLLSDIDHLCIIHSLISWEQIISNRKLLILT